MDPELLLERACAWIALWRADQAYADLHEVLLIEPSFVRAYRVLGQLLIQGGKLAGARDAFRRALSIDPSDDDARIALAAVEARLTEVARGRPEAEPPRRPSASQLARPSDERPLRAHRRFATSPGGPPGATLTTLVRRAPSAAPLHAGPPRRRIGAAPVESVPNPRPRDKTAPHRVIGGRQRTAVPVRPSSPQLHAPAPPVRPSSTQLHVPPAGSRAPTVPMARSVTAPPRAVTAPMARATTVPHVRPTAATSEPIQAAPLHLPDDE